METVEHLIVGAGPGGLRAAQVLAEAGREVLVAERHAEIGPKTCAGGLTPKAVRLLLGLGLPADSGLRSIGHVAFSGRRLVALDAVEAAVVTLPRRRLGQLQLQWTREAGADVWPGTPVSGIDLAARRARIGGRTMGWCHLIGADGSGSAVRRALGLPSPRACFAAEYNVPSVRLEPLRVECDPGGLGCGYFWVFPHCDYTSIGGVAPRRAVPPPELRRYLDRRMERLGLGPSRAPLEGAAIEVRYLGCHFSNGVHLVGDAAGLPSLLTAEGIYPALVSGEEVARRILEPDFASPGTASWLRVKRRHARLARVLGSPAARGVALAALAGVGRLAPLRRPLARWFLAG